MSAIEKTEKLWRGFWDVSKIEPNPHNPNEMTDAEFNMLYANIEEAGITDPVYCVPHPEKPCNVEEGTGWLRIIGGEHRWEVAKLCDISSIPVTVDTREDFDEDMQKAQLMRHNVIHGKVNPKKFLAMYESLSEQYADEVAAEMFGFTETADFQALLGRVEKGLPPELQDKFKAAKAELQTIEDLSSLLNYLFATYGDSLDYGYMIVDYGGKESIWLRLDPGEIDTFKTMAEYCKEAEKPVDAVMDRMLERMVDDGDLRSDLFALVETMPGLKDTKNASLDELEKLL